MGIVFHRQLEKMEYNFLIDSVKSVGEKVDMEEFRRLKEMELVFIRRHPTLPLSIMTYTGKARKWTKELLMARGLVVDDNGTIVGRPLTKFFNDYEISGSLPSGPIEVYEKMDGSMILMFFVDGEPIFCTKGTFSSEQAMKAEEIYENKYKDLNLDQDYTYNFELIYPKNKIIVDYEAEEDIFLFAKIHTKTGNEEDIHDLGFRTVKQFATVGGVDQIEELKNLDRDNEEGFVIKFENNFRVKLKFETYFKLHKAGNRNSEKEIWTLLQKGEDIPSKDLSPEELEVINKMKTDLLIKFDAKKSDLLKEYEDIKQNSNEKQEIINKIKKSSHPGAIFCFDKGKNCDPIIWTMLKPS